MYKYDRQSNRYDHVGTRQKDKQRQKAGHSFGIDAKRAGAFFNTISDIPSDQRNDKRGRVKRFFRNNWILFWERIKK
jgi:hypothetical protein